MSKLSKAVSADYKAQKESKDLHLDEVQENFMGGDSYRLDPLKTLEIIAASSIFGEPSYYRSADTSRFLFDEKYADNFSLELFSSFKDKTTTEIFTEAIDKALDYDFDKTLALASTLRNKYNMRLNPQIIMVRASLHPKRTEYTKSNPGRFGFWQSKVIQRADEPMTQIAYYLWLSGSKSKMPTILKKSLASELSKLDAYEVNKYKNREIGMINAVRITHANSEVIDELMKTGTVQVSETKQTWEQKRSQGASWLEILQEDTFGHMALLRNLRNIFTEIDNNEICKDTMQKLKDGVLKGKQFPFRYYAAYKVIEQSEVHNKALILDILEECIDISIDNLPKLKGRTVALSDNSGSAWGGIPSEYGTVKIAEIDNLSSVLAAKCSDEGTVIKFGNEYIEFPIGKRNGTLMYAKSISNNGDKDVGGSTEGGIWKYLKKCIDEKIHIDNLFIFSDQQAGLGGLYGTDSDVVEYTRRGYSIDIASYYQKMINVFKVLQDYRRLVNPKVNVFSVQTAGYSNTLVPQNCYRTSILTGWTGREIEYASRINDIFDGIDSLNTVIGEVSPA